LFMVVLVLVVLAADTLGYNLSLFSHRVHDVLTCVSAVSPIAGEAGLHLFGLGGSAGAIVAAAGALAGSGVITSLAVDAAGALALTPKFFQLELSLVRRVWMHPQGSASATSLKSAT